MMMSPWFLFCRETESDFGDARAQARNSRSHVFSSPFRSSGSARRRAVSQRRHGRRSDSAAAGRAGVVLEGIREGHQPGVIPGAAEELDAYRLAAGADAGGDHDRRAAGGGAGGVAAAEGGAAAAAVVDADVAQ